MSYTVELPATQRPSDVEGAPSLSVTTFVDAENGHMVQVTISGHFAQLTQDQVKELRRVLKTARRESLIAWPGVS
jgi:hypothetical protein